ncbi:hypothetical protein JCM10908_006162 [Rhodotorula pacifica]|uniref:uncharacterized protein n=1 Tax=Rhodotorula pacifica TaxID=1495444 RepID=UPI003173DE2A
MCCADCAGGQEYAPEPKKGDGPCRSAMITAGPPLPIKVPTPTSSDTPYAASSVSSEEHMNTSDPSEPRRVERRSSSTPPANAPTFHGSTTPTTTTIAAFPPFSGPDGVTRLPAEIPRRPAFDKTPLLYLPVDGIAIPTAFVREKLGALGHELLQSAKQASIVQNGSGDRVRVVNAPAYPPPSVVLTITFHDTGHSLETPAHALVLVATESRVLTPCYDLLALRPANHERVRTYVVLPTFPLHLPSYDAWPLLHDYLYTRSSDQLLQELAPASAADAASSIANGFRVDTVKAQRRDDVRRLDLVRQLWLSVVALQLDDEELWEVMARAWRMLYDRITRDLRPP